MRRSSVGCTGICHCTEMSHPGVSSLQAGFVMGFHVYYARVWTGVRHQGRWHSINLPASVCRLGIGHALISVKNYFSPILCTLTLGRFRATCFLGDVFSNLQYIRWKDLLRQSFRSVYAFVNNIPPYA